MKLSSIIPFFIASIIVTGCTTEKTIIEGDESTGIVLGKVILEGEQR